MGTEAKEKLKDLTLELVKITNVANTKMKQFSDQARQAIQQPKTGGAECVCYNYTTTLLTQHITFYESSNGSHTIYSVTECCVLLNIINKL